MAVAVDGIAEVSGKPASASLSAAATTAPSSSEKDKEKEKEPAFFRLANPCRVVTGQQKFVVLANEAGFSGAAGAAAGAGAAPPARYVPVRTDTSRHTGVLLLRDTQWPAPDATLSAIAEPVEAGSDGPEPPAPKSFEWEIGHFHNA
jgi:hypothetical protein